MRDGASREDVEYVFPSTLELSERPPRLVYLDLNHWIALSKALSGHREGTAYLPVLDACISAFNERRAVFPLSSTIYMEIGKIRQHRQRLDLRRVIAIVSGYYVILDRVTIATHELESLLDSLIRPSSSPISTVSYLGWGVLRSLGKSGGFRSTSNGGDDALDAIRSEDPDRAKEIENALEAAELQLNQMIIEGPSSPEEQAALLAQGWNPSSTFEVAQSRAVEEVGQVGRFNHDPRWRRGRIRDVVAAREIAIEINDKLIRGLLNRDRTIDGLFSDRAETRRAFDSMPSFDVAVSLKTSLHRNAQHRWTPNDVFDIDALASAIPYCDIVLTDKSMKSHAERDGLAERLNTLLFSDLLELLDHL